MLARYAPDAIPRAMLGGDRPREDTDEALGLLASYSMITLTTETVSIHRLLQAVILTHPDDTGDDVPSLRDTALDWLNPAIPQAPDTNTAGWPLLRALVPHAETLAGHFPPGEQPETLGRVQDEIALFLDSQGRLRAGTAATAVRAGHRRDSPGTRPPQHGYRPGQPRRSPTATWGGSPTRCPWQQRALAITETALGPDHPDTAIRLGNLAVTYRDLGRPADALPLQERALTITETALGPDHPDTAIRLGNLAATYRDLGRPADALPLQERALAITETALGPDHPDTAIRLGNLAATYRDLGRYRRRAAPAGAGAGHHRDGPGTRPPRHGHPAGQPRRHLPRPGTARRRAAPAGAGARHHRDGPGTRPPPHGHPPGQPRRNLLPPGAARRRAPTPGTGSADPPAPTVSRYLWT